MRKINRLHVAAALLMIVSVVSLLGISLAAGTSSTALTLVKIKSTTPVDPCVWWQADPSGWLGLWSPDYYSWGRTYMHLTMSASGLGAGETITVILYAKQPNATKTSFLWIKYKEFTLTDTSPSRTYQYMVPSQRFSFWAGGPSGSKISLSVYLSGS